MLELSSILQLLLIVYLFEHYSMSQEGFASWPITALTKEHVKSRIGLKNTLLKGCKVHY